MLRSIFTSICMGLALSILGLAWAEPVALPIQEAVSKNKQWQAASINDTSLTLETDFPDKTWWQQFQDPELEKLIQNALKHNQNIAMAEARLAQARATARQNLGKEFPTLSVGATGSKSENFYTRSSSSSSSNSGSSSGNGGFQVFSPNVVSTVYSFPLRVNYEPDIWFAKRDKTRAKKELVKAELEKLRATQLAVMTDVASYYFTLLGQKNQITLSEKKLVAARQDLDITQAQFEVGLINEDAVNQKRQQLALYKSQLAYANQVGQEAFNALAILEGTTPENFVLPGQSQTLAKALESIPIQSTFQAGLPSELLTRRPDILAEEAALEATKYDVRAARKAFLPLFNLGGSLGYTDIAVGSAFTLQNAAWNAVAGLTQSLFSGGQLKADLRYNKAKQKEAAHRYQETILQACKEVDDSLSALKAAYKNVQAVQETRDAVEKQNAIIQARIESGALAEGTAAQQNLASYDAKSAQIQSHLNMLIHSLSLYKALGGGY